MFHLIWSLKFTMVSMHACSNWGSGLQNVWPGIWANSCVEHPGQSASWSGASVLYRLNSHLENCCNSQAISGETMSNHVLYKRAYMGKVSRSNQHFYRAGSMADQLEVLDNTAVPNLVCPIVCCGHHHTHKSWHMQGVRHCQTED